MLDVGNVYGNNFCVEIEMASEPWNMTGSPVL